MSNTNGKVYVTATFNNTLVSITDTTGNVVAWGSAGSAGCGLLQTPAACLPRSEPAGLFALGLTSSRDPIRCRGPPVCAGDEPLERGEMT